MRACLLVVAIAACGDRPRDPLPRLAREVPATAQAVFAVDPVQLRGTWLATSVRALRALVPVDRGCLVDVVLASRRALVAELAVGRLVVIAAEAPAVECRALSRIASGVWLATLDGATAPGPGEPRLPDRPDFADIRAALVAPIGAVAPDGDPGAGVVAASAAISPIRGELRLELETPARAEAVEAALRAWFAGAAARLGDAGTFVESVRVQRTETIVTARLETDAPTASRVGPVLVVAAIGAAAARAMPTPPAAPACITTTYPITCRDGTTFTVKPELRTTILVALRAMKPAPRVVNGQVSGVKLGAIADDTVLAALGLRAGDTVLAVDGRRLDTREAIDELPDQLRRAATATITVERDGSTLELRYTLAP